MLTFNNSGSALHTGQISTNKAEQQSTYESLAIKEKELTHEDDTEKAWQVNIWKDIMGNTHCYGFQGKCKKVIKMNI